jgi:starch-binding outer membrane protein, SusD/RagB family
MKYYIYFALFALIFNSCEMEELPQASVSKYPVFNSEAGLKLYSISFYNVLPDSKEIYAGDHGTDYLAETNINAFFTASFGPSESTGWSWTNLRNINYFIENCKSEDVPLAVREHYIGLARFWRAFFYFNMVKRFGDVPWISRPIDINDTEKLYAGRDPRKMVMDSVLADINYAIAKISTEKHPTSSIVTKWVAYGLKSRICLFEGTFRKYHSKFALQETANFWLEQAATAAKEIMDNSGYKLNLVGGVDLAYRNLFISPLTVNDEVMFALTFDKVQNVMHASTFYYISPTYGSRPSLTRTFVNTYLNLDGTPFTSKMGYETMIFPEEVKNRDLRLKQTIRTGNYARLNAGLKIISPPDFSHTLTGYMPIKWSDDDTYYETGGYSINSISIIRYAEVLLNYAEAKAELGTLTNSDWERTIGALRARAGITNGLTQLPTVVDVYLQTTYFPDISNPVILEVRRERSIELVLEGFRFYDLVRWKRGELVKAKWRGIYVPQLNDPMDLNEDGIFDVIFVEVKPSQIPNVPYKYVVVGPINNSTLTQSLTNGASGELTWMDNVPRNWEDKHYFYPIPLLDILKNPKLNQNPGW